MEVSQLSRRGTEPLSEQRTYTMVSHQETRKKQNSNLCSLVVGATAMLAASTPIHSRYLRRTVNPTTSPLNRPSESHRTTPPPRAPSSSTATKVSTPGGFLPGEFAGIQETSRIRNASTAGAGQADAHKSGRDRETRHPPTHAHSSPAHERAGSQATRRRPKPPRFRRGAGAGR